MIVTETIHHGQYRSTRTAAVVPTTAGLREYLMHSDYPPVPSTDEHVGILLTELVETGEADLGWAHFEVVPACPYAWVSRDGFYVQCALCEGHDPTPHTGEAADRTIHTRACTAPSGRKE